MEISSQAFSERYSQEFTKVVHGRVYCGTRDGEQHQCENTSQEHVEIKAHNCLHNVSIYISQPDTQISTHNKQPGQDNDIKHLLGLPVRHGNRHQLLDPLPEHTIDITLASLYTFKQCPFTYSLLRQLSSTLILGVPCECSLRVGLVGVSLGFHGEEDCRSDCSRYHLY